MLIKEFNDFNSLESIKDQWDSFVKKEKPEQWFFHSYEWYRNWWETFGTHRRPLVLLAYDDEKIVGIATFYLERTFYLGLYTNLIKLMGNEHSPKNSLIIKGNEKGILAVLLNHLISSNKKALIYFEDLPGNDDISINIIEYCKNKSIDHKERVSRITSIIRINEGWEEYIKSRRFDKFYKKVRQVENKVKALNSIDIVKCHSRSELMNCFELLKSVSLNSWQGRKGSSFCATSTLFNYYYKIAELAAAAGILDIKVLKIDQIPVAYTFGINMDGYYYAYKKEFDNNYINNSPGIYLDIIGTKEAFENKYKIVDMLGYKTFDKERWATDFIEDKRIFIYQGVNAKLIKYIDFNARNAIKRIIGKYNG